MKSFRNISPPHVLESARPESPTSSAPACAGHLEAAGFAAEARLMTPANILILPVIS